MRNTRSPQRPKSGPAVGLSSPIGWYKQCKTTGEWFDHQIGCEPLTCITRQPSVKPWKILMIMSCSFTIRPLWWYTTDLTTLWRYTSSRSMRGERIRSVRCKTLNWCSEQHIRRRRGKHAALSATHRVYEASAIQHGLGRRAGLDLGDHPTRSGPTPPRRRSQEEGSSSVQRSRRGQDNPDLAPLPLCPGSGERTSRHPRDATAS